MLKYKVKCNRIRNQMAPESKILLTETKNKILEYFELGGDSPYSMGVPKGISGAEVQKYIHWWEAAGFRTYYNAENKSVEINLE